MTFHPAQLLDHPIQLEETLPATILDLDENGIRAEEPVEVNLFIEGDEEQILVRGELSTKLKLECGRCLKWLDWPIEVNDFIVELSAPFPMVIDLTSQIREDILLRLPLAAACRLDDDYRCPYSGKEYPPANESPSSIAGEEVWQALDQLKKKE